MILVTFFLGSEGHIPFHVTEIFRSYDPSLSDKVRGFYRLKRVRGERFSPTLS